MKFKEIILKIKEKIAVLKGFFYDNKKDIIIMFIIFLFGFASFGLGRLSVEKNQKEPIKILDPKDTEIMLSSLKSGEVVASKNGTKYHLPWCSGAKTISPENKIVFKSKEEAEKAGYEPASNCKGI